MANKMYVKDDMNFEGISMQEGKSSSTLKLLIFMIVTAVVLGLLIFTAGSFFSDKSNNEQDTPGITILPTSAREEEPTAVSELSPAASVTVSPTPRTTVKPTVTSSQKISPTGSSKTTTLSLEILNGSGVKGAAGKMSTTLTAAGYTVISTGNADSFSYTGVSVEIKKSKTSLLDKLKKDLSAAGYLVTDTKTTLTESSTADAVIILGTEQ